MLIRKFCLISNSVIILLLMLLTLSGCDLIEEVADPFVDDVHYWYDYNGNLIHTETASYWDNPSFPLPKDTEKWHYIYWSSYYYTSDLGCYIVEHTPLREPKNSYFTGNVFQIVINDLDNNPIGTGSGFVFNNEGWFVTNAHVMENAFNAKAIFNIPNSFTGESYTYLGINSGTYYNIDRDIYIGKIENYNQISNFYKDIPINFEYKIYEDTYSVGYPNASVELKINKGSIKESSSDLYDKLYTGNSYICSSSYITYGSSGGILVNENLEVIGMTTKGWIDENDKFLLGASISAFNYAPLFSEAKEENLITLQERFHSDKKEYIECFNKAKEDYTNGDAEKVPFDGESSGYKFDLSCEDINESGVAYSMSDFLTLYSDGYMLFTNEALWENGETRKIAFGGYYTDKKGFSDFEYLIYCEYANGEYFSIYSNDINYSPTISLTLTTYEIEEVSEGIEVSAEEIQYAKEQFNCVYELLNEKIGELKEQ